MHILRRPDWALPERDASPRDVWLNRRALIAGLGLGAIAGPSFGAARWMGAAARNPDFADGGREITPLEISGDHNNFYEFGSSKRIARAARRLDTSEWTVAVDGLVDRPETFSTDDLIRHMPFEERVVRHRCVETWAFVVPWIGFPLEALLRRVGVKPEAKYIRFESFSDSKVARNQRQFWFPWPYSEVLTLEEATNPLAFMVMGAYGEVLPNQFGAPIRLHTPWKYGFKSIKSITKIELVDERPISFWEELQEDEYGFWANINPKVPHPRWSQKYDRDLATGDRIPTRLFNGYGEQVAHLYKGLEKKHGERLWR